MPVFLLLPLQMLWSDGGEQPGVPDKQSGCRLKWWKQILKKKGDFSIRIIELIPLIMLCLRVRTDMDLKTDHCEVFNFKTVASAFRENADLVKCCIYVVLKWLYKWQCNSNNEAVSEFSPWPLTTKKLYSTWLVPWNFKAIWTPCLLLCFFLF